MQCVEFDARLADVLDGMMSGAELEAFKAHAAACMDCGPLFTQAQAGMQALKSLAAVEPPVNLFHNIIARTSAIDPAMQPRLALHDRCFHHVGHHGVEGLVHRHAEGLPLGQLLLAVA